MPASFDLHKTAAEHGMKPDEVALMVKTLGRDPSLCELGIFSAMWSEHCSYKSSKVWLRKLPTTGDIVICGPGENAGVIDIGLGPNGEKLAAIFKIESHNHPSFIEPYQGAATGVGGILRDVFTMGARPIANLNALRYGDIKHPKTKQLLAGTVAGIGGYGNCMGIPTVAGEVNFHPSYNGNCLVNAMTVGVANQDKIFYAKAAGVGNPVCYVGSKTGRDGIKGASMSSAEFNDNAESQRPTVQVGDPFTEKLLLEACLELMATDAIVAIQDMGAAGLTSSSVEMASKGGLGMELILDDVPQRETGMNAYEMMISESQERMLMILKPGREAQAEAVFKKWDLDCVVIGKLTDTGRLVVKHKGNVEADIVVEPLVENAPQYNRPWEPTPKQAEVNAADYPLQGTLGAALETLLACPDLCSRRWIYEQYDCQVGADTIATGGDAGVVRLHGSKRGLAMTVDCTPRYCFADPVEGGKQAVAETWRNLTAVGAKPLAITDNMNFGNPEKPRIMGQFAGCVEGIAAACNALTYPVISGNVSLYNETKGEGILPTPVIGGVGMVEDVSKIARINAAREGDVVLLVGETKGHIGQSLYLRELHGKEIGTAPTVDLNAEKKNGDFVRALINAETVPCCHDVADGGLLVALADICLASNVGIALEQAENSAAYWFGEDQGRYIITIRAHQYNEQAIFDAAEKAGVEIEFLGFMSGQDIKLDDKPIASLATLRKAHEGTLPALMES
ncbi:MAG: phosphoribosylformylglycinamidine synthase subunit PurL [Alphaproteobacteria bacterium]|nr:phosphoribosylformylglycinamidine synthase subunit PurL [Alphaproteobacteria bacterium]